MNWTKKISSLFLIAAFMFLSTSVFAQERSKTADDFSSRNAAKLQVQLNLSQDQLTQIEQIFTEYNTSKTADATVDANAEMLDTKEEVNEAIYEVLDDTQKTTWENVKANFWAEVDAETDGIKETQNEQY